LFLIAAEGLEIVFRMAIEKNLIDNVKIGWKKMKVNMLQYATDTIFFCEENNKSFFNIIVALNCFELSYGFKVNFMKRRNGGMGVDQITIYRFAAILNCEVMVTPFVFLGMSVGGSIREGSSGLGWLIG